MDIRFINEYNIDRHLKERLGYMNTLYSIIFLYLGATLASFANCLTYRLCKKEKISGKSYCDNCHNDLRLIDVLPIFGFIFNLGKCHHCQKKISYQHLVWEIFGGFLFLISFLIINEISWELLVSYILITVLLIETMMDIRSHQVIDIVWIVGILVVIIIRIIQSVFLTYLISSLALFAIMISLALLGKMVFKKDSLGGGDIKLYLFIGFLLSFPEGILSILLAAIFGLIYAMIFKIKSGKEMAFVPMISLAVLICYFYGTEIINAYFNLFGM